MAVRGNVVIVGKKPVSDYVLSIILLFNQGHDTVVIRAKGDAISKAVDVYNALKARLADSIELESVNIDSQEVGRRLIPMIEIRVKRTL